MGIENVSHNRGRRIVTSKITERKRKAIAEQLRVNSGNLRSTTAWGLIRGGGANSRIYGKESKTIKKIKSSEKILLIRYTAVKCRNSSKFIGRIE